MDQFVINSSMQPAQLAAAVDQFMTAEGYKVEEGQAGNAVYANGNKIARALLGGFVKRNKFRVQVYASEAGSQMCLSKDAKGYTGGALGVRKTNKEFERLHALLATRLQ